MWTAENRARYNRDHLRYPSDLTDAEWNEIAPLIAPARSGGRRREVDVQNLVNGVMYVLSTGCQWRYIPKDFPPKSTVYRYFWDWSRDGTLDRIHDALYVKCRENSASRPVPARASSIARASRALKKGGPHRSARLRCGQADQGKEAPYSRRHARSGFTGAHHASRRARSGRRPPVAVDFVWNVPVSQKALRRQRLPRACVSNCARIGSATPRNGNHQTATRRQGLRRAAQTMDCRTQHRMAEPLPKTGQGLGESEHQRPHFPSPRLNPPHAPKAM